MTSFLLLAVFLPSALQDYRHRRVSNALTLPAFLAAWPLALYLGGPERLLFTLTVFLGCWLAWRTGGMGGADAKLATFLAALQPTALAVGGLVLVGLFLGMRWRWRERRSVPGVVGLYLGLVATGLLEGMGMVSRPF